MTVVVPLDVWVPVALALAGAGLALAGDALKQQLVARWGAVVGLGAAAAWGAWRTVVASPGVEVGWFVSGGGHTTLPAVAYALGACAAAIGASSIQRGRPGRTWSVVTVGVVASHLVLTAVDVIALLVSAVVLIGVQSVATVPRGEEFAERRWRPSSAALVVVAIGIVWLAVLLALGGGQSDGVALGRRLSESTGVSALVALGLGVAFLAGVLGTFPFTGWVAHAADRPSASAAALAGASRIAGGVALVVALKGTVFASGAFTMSGQVVAAFALASLVVGILGAVAQEDAGRAVGLLMVAGAAFPLLGATAGDAGITAAVIHLVPTAVGGSAALLALAVARRLTPPWDGSITGLRGLGRRHPLVGGSLVLSLFTMAGMPPFAGGWGLLHVVAALVASRMTGLALIAALAAAGAAVVAVTISVVVFDDAGAPFAEADRPAPTESVVLALLAITLVALALAPVLLGVGRVYAVFVL